jgi:hypothetical protein
MNKENIENQMIATTIKCSTCFKVIHSDNDILAAELKRNTTLKYLKHDDDIVCINCTQTSIQLHKINNRNNQLQTILNTITNTSSYSWNKSKSLNSYTSNYSYFQTKFKYHERLKNDHLYISILSNIKILKVDIKEIHDKKKILV